VKLSFEKMTHFFILVMNGNPANPYFVPSPLAPESLLCEFLREKLTESKSRKANPALLRVSPSSNSLL